VSDKVSNLTTEQQGHISTLVRLASAAMFDKYRAGAAEHGGNLWDLSTSTLLDNAVSEAIDQVIYLMTLRDKVKQLQMELSKVVESATSPTSNSDKTQKLGGHYEVRSYDLRAHKMRVLVCDTASGAYDWALEELSPPARLTLDQARHIVSPMLISWNLGLYSAPKIEWFEGE
jgi:hypothetical protein